MLVKLFRPGCRLFTVGSLLMLLTAAAHTAGHFSPIPENDAPLKSAIAAMTGYRLDMGMGMQPSLLDVQLSLSLTMTILLVFLGVQNLVTIYLAGDSVRLVRGLSIVNLFNAAALTALYWHYRLPPPLICFALISVIFLLALALPTNRDVR
ncbi:MAG: LIC_13387 family protein [Blastocatellia bacterium]